MAHARKTASPHWTTCLLVSIFLLVLLSLPAGCGSAPGEDRDAGLILLHDDNNYRAMGSLRLPTVETASATDVELCWSGIVDDLQCHAVDAQSDLDNVALLRIRNLSKEEVEAKLISGELKQSELDGYLDFNVDHIANCAKLSQFSFFGTSIDVAVQYVEDETKQYLLLFTTGTDPGVGVRAMTFLQPKVSSNNTRVDAPSGCGQLDFPVDLSSVQKVLVPAAGPWVIDWRNLTRNGQGGPLVTETIDKLLLGFYQGMTLADLQRQIFDYESIATSVWELPLAGGRTADLSMARERGSGVAFSGFTRHDGVWALGLLCTTCQNPAPVVLTILEPSWEGP